MPLIRVVSYNIHKGRSFGGRDALADLRLGLHGLRPDVLFLQEVQGRNDQHVALHAQHESLAAALQMGVSASDGAGERAELAVAQLRDEVRAAPLDEAGRNRLKEIYETSLAELSAGLSQDLREELARMAPPVAGDTPTNSELRIAQAQLVGWLEGLFHGIQAALMAQQMAARAQLDQMRQGSLPEGGPGPSMRPGTYL